MDYIINSEQYKILVEEKRKYLDRQTKSYLKKNYPEYPEFKKIKWLYHNENKNKRIELWLNITVKTEWLMTKTKEERKELYNRLDLDSEMLFDNIIGKMPNVFNLKAMIIPIANEYNY